MFGPSFLQMLLQQLLYTIPQLLVFGLAAILAIVFISRAPRAAWLTLSGALLLILSNTLFACVRAYLFSDAIRDRGPSFGTLIQVVSIFDLLIDLVGWLLLISAIFVERPPARTSSGAPIPSSFPPPPPR